MVQVPFKNKVKFQRERQITINKILEVKMKKYPQPKSIVSQTNFYRGRSSR